MEDIQSAASNHARQRPDIYKKQAVELALKLFGLHPTDHQETKELDSYNDRNFLIKGKLKTAEENLFVLKVFNSEVSTFEDSLRINADIVPFVNSVKLECPVPQTSIYGTKYVLCRFKAPTANSENTLQKDIDNDLEVKKSPDFFEVVSFREEQVEGINVCAVQLFGFIHGKTLGGVQWTEQLLMDYGSKIAHMHSAFKQYSQVNEWVSSVSFKPHDWPWIHVKTPQSIQRHCHVIADQEQRTMVENIAQQFNTAVLHKLSSKEFQLVHGDMSCYNIVTRETNQGNTKVIGVIDFGEKDFSHPLIDLGVAIAYIGIEASKKNYDVIQVTSHVMTGYQSVIPLSSSEIYMVLYSALARIALSIVMGTYQYRLSPDNDYLVLTPKGGWKLLYQLEHIPQSDIVNRWGMST